MVGVVIRTLMFWSALIGLAAIGLSNLWRSERHFAQMMFAGIEGVGEVRGAKSSKGGELPPDAADALMLCVTAAVDLVPGAATTPPSPLEVAGGRRFGGDWQPTPMPQDAREGMLSLSCSDLWEPEAAQRARTALDEPGSFWAAWRRGSGRADDEWHLYSPRYGIVAYAKAGPDG